MGGHTMHSTEKEKTFYKGTSSVSNGLFKCIVFFHIYAMAETQSAPKVSNLPRTSLHVSYLKFTTETVKVISNIDGANEMKVRVHDKLPSVFSVTVNKPPKMTPDDLNQLQMLNNRLRKIKFDFESNRLILESWKFKKDPQTKSVGERQSISIIMKHCHRNTI